MKKLNFTLFLLLSLASRAAIFTVNNNPGGAMYSSLQGAIDAAAYGDTIYVHGSTTSYGDATIIGKKLTVIGPGMEPDVTPSFRATIGNLRILNIDDENSNGCVIMGLNFEGSLRSNTAYANPIVKNLKIVRNRFQNAKLVFDNGIGFISGHLVEGNFFLNSTIDVPSNNPILNCIFINNIMCRNNSNSYFLYGFANCSNVVFDHNVFYSNDNTNSPLFFSTINNVIFKNNVFSKLLNNVTPHNGGANIFNCSFLNNITFNCADNSPWLLGNNANLGGNITNQSPQMVSQTDINNAVGSSLLNFTIATGVANNAGTDGKDLGVLFDTNTYMNWTNGRNSRIPYIRTITINNTTVTQGGTLQLQLTTRRAN
ncbi:hypothetical protein [Emticicia sp. SJ17W-69]|uniref:hypothetical protein n=1 Tax=Emticicia sp. SJ17W-69 TaxID=3421657 RepID=UPI003EB8E0BF